MRRVTAVVPVTAAFTLLAAPPALGSRIGLAMDPVDTRYGQPHSVTGRLRAGDGTPLAGRRVTVQVRRYPYDGRFRAAARVTTDERGRFRVRRLELDRNADVRAVAFDGTVSRALRAFTYPAARLRYRVLDRDSIRLVQTYRTPRSVRLTRRTLFYVGAGSASTAPIRARARTRRTEPGRFRATAVVRLRPEWDGRFHYASCFRYSPGSGMGDPDRGCPRRYRFQIP